MSGKSYLRYIQECFKTEVKIAGKSQNDLLPDESHYYSRDQDDCYNMPLARMDSCAGLIIRPEDLVTKVAEQLPDESIN